MRYLVSVAVILGLGTWAAALTNVSITDGGLVPSRISIPLNETVRWTNNGVMYHTVTSVNGYWDSGPLAPGLHYDRTFGTLGGFGYYCIYHPFMTGTVNVGNTAVAPASLGRVKVLFK